MVSRRVRLANFIVSDDPTHLGTVNLACTTVVSVGNYESQFCGFTLLLSTRPLRVEVILSRLICRVSLQRRMQARRKPCSRVDNSTPNTFLTKQPSFSTIPTHARVIEEETARSLTQCSKSSKTERSNKKENMLHFYDFF